MFARPQHFLAGHYDFLSGDDPTVNHYNELFVTLFVGSRSSHFSGLRYKVIVTGLDFSSVHMEHEKNLSTLYLVYGSEEWSFGFCEYGSGVFSCPPTKNPMYTFRETIVLGETDCTNSRVNQILRELGRVWPGSSYDLLSRNCNHFCDDFCEKLGVQKLPAWVNRFANAGDAALEVAESTAVRLRQAKEEIISASKVAYRFLAGVASNSTATPNNPDNPTNGSSRFEGAWFRNIISPAAKPSSSTLPEDSTSSSSSSSSTDDEHTLQNENSLSGQMQCHN